MNPLGNKVLSSLLACTAAASLASCGGGRHSAALPQPAPTSAVADYTGPLVNATFVIRIPGPTNSAFKRRPSYVSSATLSIKFVINSSSTVGGTATTGTLGSYNARPWSHFDTGTLPNATCPASGPDFVCTVPILIPPGSDNITISACDVTGGTCAGPSPTGHILSQQVATFVVTAGGSAAGANNFTVILDANTATVDAIGSQPCQSGTVVASTYGSVGTSAVTFPVLLRDLAGKTIVSPGLPLLSILDNTTGLFATSGTINGTTGHVTFTVNQSAQSFTLTPSASDVAGVSVQIKAVPASATDGLPQGGVTKTFTFSTGPAPGSGFMAAVESNVGASTGQIDLFTVGLVNGGTDTITPYVTSGGGTTLTPTASLNEPGHSDVDNPEALQFDSGGNLLIANGGSTTGGDNGNLACVPAGSIATGLANATTNSNNVDLGSPQNPLAYLTDGTAVLANHPTNASLQSVAFTLSGNYVFTAGRSYAAPSYGAYAVLALPAGTTPYADGSYAVALTNGIDNQHVPATGLNKVTIVSSTGVTTDLTDATGINEPFSLAWDAINHELVVANQSSHTLNVAWFTLNPFAKKTSINTNLNHYLAATASNGYTAVAGSSANGFAQIQIFKNDSPTRTLVGIIPYNQFVSTTTCTPPYVYPASVVTSMLWLSNTKLLVGLKTSDSTKRGLYIYDINQTQTNPGKDDQTCLAEPNGPKATVFYQLTNTPLGAAYKP